MLEFLRGRVEVRQPGAVVISLGGVGLRVEMPTTDLAKLDDGEVLVHTVMHVKDEQALLYGFATPRGRELFRMLTTVSGIGPKVALAILSAYAPDALERTLAAGDVGALTAITGVGKRKAERIVVDLKDKVGTIVDAVSTNGNGSAPSAIAEVRAGLMGLGYSSDEIQQALADLPPDGDAPTLLRHALRFLGRDRTGGDR